MKADGVLVDAVSRRRDRARAARRLHGRGRAGRRGLHRRRDRRGDTGARRRARRPGQRGLGRHARAARPQAPRPSGLAAHEPRLRPRPQPQDQHGRGLEQARHLAREPGRGAAQRREVPARPGRPAHAHRLGRRQRAPRARLRGDGRAGAGARASTCAPSRAAAGCRSRTAPTTPAFDAARCTDTGMRRGARSRRCSGTRCRSRSSPAASSSPKSGALVSRVLAGKRMGGNALPARRRRLQRSGPAGDVRQLPRDLGRPRDGDAARRPDRADRRRWTAVRVGRRVHAGRGRGGGDRASCPPPRWATWSVLHDAGAYGAAQASNYNSRPLLPELLVDGGHVRVIRRRQTHRRAARAGRDLAR